MKPYYKHAGQIIYLGNCLDVLKTFSNESVDCCVTSPPYWGLRDYGVDEQLGLEKTFEEYINKLCSIFDEVKRILLKRKVRVGLILVILIYQME